MTPPSAARAAPIADAVCAIVGFAAWYAPAAPLKPAETAPVATLPAMRASRMPFAVATIEPARPFTMVGTCAIITIAASATIRNPAASVRSTAPSICASISSPMPMMAPMTPASTSGIRAKPSVKRDQVVKRSLVPRNRAEAMKIGAIETAMARPILAKAETRIATQAIRAPMTTRSTEVMLMLRNPLSAAARSEKSKMPVTIASSAALSVGAPAASISSAPIEPGTLVSMS